jgi:hypothetical protein
MQPLRQIYNVKTLGVPVVRLNCVQYAFRIASVEGPPRQHASGQTDSASQNASCGVVTFSDLGPPCNKIGMLRHRHRPSRVPAPLVGSGVPLVCIPGKDIRHHKYPQLVDAVVPPERPLWLSICWLDASEIPRGSGIPVL